jgi:hypothetical protein
MCAGHWTASAIGLKSGYLQLADVCTVRSFWDTGLNPTPPWRRWAALMRATGGGAVRWRNEYQMGAIVNAAAAS